MPTASPSGTVTPSDTARVQIIVVESRGRAEQVRAALDSGADFAALAKERSIDPSAASGGHLGDVRLTTLRADLQEALRAVARGRVTAITPVPTGYAVLRIVPEEPKAGASAPPSFGAPALGGLPQFGGVRYPPNTSGTFDVEALFRAMPKPKGWNSDLGLLCELHRATPRVAVERLSELLDGDPNAVARMAPNDLVLAHYMRAVIESSQGRMDQAIGQWEKAYQVALAKLPASAAVLEEVLGSAHFHKAEMENGLYRTPGERCLFPPRPGNPSWRFEKTADAEKAAAYFT